MKEFLFVIKVLVLTIAVVIVMQFKYEGKSLETRASLLFGSSETIPWIRKQSQKVINKFNDRLSEVKKVDTRIPLDEVIKKVPEFNDISEIDFKNKK